MSSNDLARDLEERATAIAIEAGALVPCDRHEHIRLRRGGEDAERRAYAFAHSAVRDGKVSFPQHLVGPAIKAALDEGLSSCDQCASERK